MATQKPDVNVQAIPVCTECHTKPWLEMWEGTGLVLVCECGQWQNIKTTTTLPEEWSA